jgi:ABC-type polysaccharide/polyol phosphate transport system ATPase subunit
MHGSDASPDGPALELWLDGGERPSILVECVSRRYAPPRAGRTRKLFAIFGGVESDIGPIEEEEDDEDDDTFADLDDVAEERPPADRDLALDAISLRLSGGGCVAFVGPSGAGKSVLLRLVAGVTPPDSGRVTVHGLVAPILTSLVPLIPRQGRAHRGVRVLASLARLPRAEVRDRLGDIFAFLGDARLAQASLSNFSTRRKRELLFATMLTMDSDIVLVDCPLPPGELGERCRSRLVELRDRGALVIIAARRADDVSWIADHVVEMRGGRLAARVDSSEEAARSRLS